MAPKRLFVFCDGTGQDGLICPDGPTDSRATASADSMFFEGAAKTIQVLAAAQDPVPYVTNVLRLSRSVNQYSSTGIQQIVFYQSGVASDANFEGNIDDPTKYQQATGLIVASKIRDAYAFIAQNFEPGDEIFLFGFSRGAYTARKLSGLIDKIGLLTTENLGIFFNIWSSLVAGKEPSIPSNTRKTNIRCVGVWDTVGSVLGTIDALSIKDTSLPATVEVALHGLSIQENRETFLPTLWSVPSGGLAPGQILKQIWFPGAHSDVGGGYERHELADIALYWMTGEIVALDLFDLDTNFLIRSKQDHPDDWGTSQPHNAYMETSIWLRPIIGEETRLVSGSLNASTVLHESWQYSPKSLTDPDYMVTPDALASQYPSLPYAPLNAFEAQVKKDWKTKLPMFTQPVPYDNPSVLFPGSKVSLRTSNADEAGGLYE